MFAEKLELIVDAIQDQIREYAEKNFEQERDNSYTENFDEINDKISSLSNMEKEEIRVSSLRELKIEATFIREVWRKIILRSAKIRIITDLVTDIFLWVAFFGFFFRMFELMIFFGAAGITLSIMQRSKRVYPVILGFFSGTWFLSDDLLRAYQKYGTLEATIACADYRNLSRISEDRKNWIYTTTIKKVSPQE